MPGGHMPTYNSRGFPLYSDAEDMPGWDAAFNSQSNLLATALDISEAAAQDDDSVVTIAALPVTGNWVGRRIFVEEDESLRVWNGTVWHVFSLVPLSFTPVWTTTGTPPSLGNSELTCTYTLQGRHVTGILLFTVGTTGVSGGSGTWRFSLPYASSQLGVAYGIVNNAGVGAAPIVAEIAEGDDLLSFIVTGVQAIEDLAMTAGSIIRLTFDFDIA